MKELPVTWDGKSATLDAMTSTNLRFDRTVAVITGAGGGLGKQYARCSHRAASRIVVNDTGGSVTGDGFEHQSGGMLPQRNPRARGEAVADSHKRESPEGERRSSTRPFAPGDESTS